MPHQCRSASVPPITWVRRRHASALLVSCAVLVAGCATPPDLGVRPDIMQPDHYAVERSFTTPRGAWPSERWWEAYGDAQLNALIEEALADAPTLAAAAARMRQAEAAAQQAGANRLPSITADANAQVSDWDVSFDSGANAPSELAERGRVSQSSAVIGVAYQVDFFGRNRASLAAATSRAEAAEAEFAAARLQLSSAVALAYAELLRLHGDRVAIQQILRMREESARLVRQRVVLGVENEGQAHQADAKLRAARAEAIGTDGAIVCARNAISALLGKGPDRGLDIALPQSARLTAIGLPGRVELDLVGRRPDLVAARLRAEAVASRIDVARADFYPNVNLVALIGWETFAVNRLGDVRGRFAQFGPALSLPIFSGGRIEGGYRGARAEYDEAVALYDQTLANALRELADALSERRTLEGQLTEAREALVSFEAAYRVARARYEGGLTSYIDALAVEDGLVAQRRAVADLEARTFSADINFIRALGGGFVAP